MYILVCICYILKIHYFMSANINYLLMYWILFSNKANTHKL